MRGIALKIFLSFWATQAVVIAAFALLPDRAGDFRLVDHLRHDGAIAIGLLESDGPASCDRFIQMLATRGHVSLRVRDADEAGLCGLEQESGVGDSRVTLRSNGRAYTVSGRAQPGFASFAGPPAFPWTNVVLAIVVSGVVCFALARYLAAPLRQVRDVSYRLAAGDLQARAGPAVGVRRDEIGDLVRDFDTMAARIEALVHAQSQLLSDISHELRSPLARLGVALELARRKAGHAAQSDLDRLEIEAGRMNELIGRVLALARAETPQATRPFQPVELVDVARVVTEDADYEAREQHKAVRMDAAANPAVRGDVVLLTSAVDNVVRNAVRHTPEGTAVEVRLACTASEAVLTVRDYGPGVPVADLERIFSPFHRVDTGRVREAGGVGLGLAIARRAVALHKGTITAAPASGGGLEVTIRLPLVSMSSDVH
jgi:two-component system sensor histidine kinase CpxA